MLWPEGGHAEVGRMTTERREYAIAGTWAESCQWCRERGNSAGVHYLTKGGERGRSPNVGQATSHSSLGVRSGRGSASLRRYTAASKTGWRESWQGRPGWHFDTAEATLKELLELGADLQPEAAGRVEDAVRHVSHATTLLNEYVTLSEGERARRAGQVKTARADLLACVNSLEAMVPPKLLGPRESQALPPRLRR
jgi:hypothetical protein